jgi:hypothetical protein
MIKSCPEDVDLEIAQEVKNRRKYVITSLKKESDQMTEILLCPECGVPDCHSALKTGHESALENRPT